MDMIGQLAEELGIRRAQAEAAVRLIDEGNTIPFIARYRKEVTGALNDEVLRNLHERLLYLRNLQDRKETVLAGIEEQGKLTPELKAQIESAATLVAVEDLYLPYRPKRRTRATIAKERGLEPLADLLLSGDFSGTPEEAAMPFVDPKKDVHTPREALAGASDILAERLSEDAQIRARIREMTMQQGRIVSKVKDRASDARGVFEMYYEFDEPVAKLPGHRTLALNRGEKEKVLAISVEAPEEEILAYMRRHISAAGSASGKDRAAGTETKIGAETKIGTETKGSAEAKPGTDLNAGAKDSAATGEHGDGRFAFLADMAADSYHRLIAPAIEREVRNQLTEEAEDGAIKVFGKNLTQLLLQPPIAGQVVLGWDPAFRTGCKLAVVDPTGKVLDTTVIYPTAPQNRVGESKQILKHWIEKYHITLISLGNGTASRESEAVITELLREIPAQVSYVIVNEAGASVYSASRLATEEFPQFDVGQRSAASIARRLQDPLSELVKIEPKAIGVGQYQHDMNQKKLGESLSGVVEDAVNRVGVDLNTASASLLEYVSGVNKTIAKNIVTYREEHGAFRRRKDLLDVPKLGPKAYEQCAGFLRIRGGAEPLDATSVHPESYAATKQLLALLSHDVSEVASGGLPAIRREVPDVEKMAEELGIGALTLADILEELQKPGRDPRQDMPAPILRRDVMEMKDLKPGMILKGTVRNVIDFGAFVDIGVHQDGLVHISRICDRFIKHPLEAVSVGDIVDVQVLDVDLQKQRIALTMRIGQEDGRRSDEKQGHSGSRGGERQGQSGSRGKSGNAEDARGRQRNPGRQRQESANREPRRGAMWDALQNIKGQLPKE